MDHETKSFSHATCASPGIDETSDATAAMTTTPLEKQSKLSDRPEQEQQQHTIAAEARGRRRPYRTWGDRVNLPLNVQTDIDGFAYLGFHVKVVYSCENWRDRSTWKWTEGVIKFWSPKFRRFFIHFIEDPGNVSQDPGTDILWEVEPPHAARPAGDRGWFSITENEIRVLSLTTIWRHPSHLTPEEFVLWVRTHMNSQSCSVADETRHDASASHVCVRCQKELRRDDPTHCVVCSRCGHAYHLDCLEQYERHRPFYPSAQTLASEAKTHRAYVRELRRQQKLEELAAKKRKSETQLVFGNSKRPRGTPRDEFLPEPTEHDGSGATVSLRPRRRCPGKERKLESFSEESESPDSSSPASRCMKQRQPSTRQQRHGAFVPTTVKCVKAEGSCEDDGDGRVSSVLMEKERCFGKSVPCTSVVPDVCSKAPPPSQLKLLMSRSRQQTKNAAATTTSDDSRLDIYIKAESSDSDAEESSSTVSDPGVVVDESGSADGIQTPNLDTVNSLSTPSSAVWACPACLLCHYCCEPLHQIPSVIPTERSVLPALDANGKPFVMTPFVVCHSCGLSAHGACCFPEVPVLHPHAKWRCDRCAVCQSCGYRDLLWVDYTGWDLTFEHCIRCFKAMERGEYCAVCRRVWAATEGQWLQCESCRLWVHFDCDSEEASKRTEVRQASSSLDDGRRRGADAMTYRCPTCRHPERKERYLRILDQLTCMDRRKELSYPVPKTFLNYWRIVKRPMNFAEMRAKVYRGDYHSDDDVLADFALVVHNAKIVHMPNTRIHRSATTIGRRGAELIRSVLELPKPSREALASFHMKISKLASLPAHDGPILADMDQCFELEKEALKSMQPDAVVDTHRGQLSVPVASEELLDEESRRLRDTSPTGDVSEPDNAAPLLPQWRRIVSTDHLPRSTFSKKRILDFQQQSDLTAVEFFDEDESNDDDDDKGMAEHPPRDAMNPGGTASVATDVDSAIPFSMTLSVASFEARFQRGTASCWLCNDDVSCEPSGDVLTCFTCLRRVHVTCMGLERASRVSSSGLILCDACQKCPFCQRPLHHHGTDGSESTLPSLDEPFAAFCAGCGRFAHMECVWTVDRCTKEPRVCRISSEGTNPLPRRNSVRFDESVVYRYHLVKEARGGDTRVEMGTLRDTVAHTETETPHDTNPDTQHWPQAERITAESPSACDSQLPEHVADKRPVVFDGIKVQQQQRTSPMTTLHHDAGQLRTDQSNPHDYDQYPSFMDIIPRWRVLTPGLGTWRDLSSQKQWPSPCSFECQALPEKLAMNENSRQAGTQNANNEVENSNTSYNAFRPDTAAFSYRAFLCHHCCPASNTFRTSTDSTSLSSLFQPSLSPWLVPSQRTFSRSHLLRRTETLNTTTSSSRWQHGLPPTNLGPFLVCRRCSAYCMAYHYSDLADLRASLLDIPVLCPDCDDGQSHAAETHCSLGQAPDQDLDVLVSELVLCLTDIRTRVQHTKDVRELLEGVLSSVWSRRGRRVTKLKSLAWEFMKHPSFLVYCPRVLCDGADDDAWNTTSMFGASSSFEVALAVVEVPERLPSLQRWLSKKQCLTDDYCFPDTTWNLVRLGLVGRGTRHTLPVDEDMKIQSEWTAKFRETLYADPWPLTWTPRRQESLRLFSETVVSNGGEHSSSFEDVHLWMGITERFLEWQKLTHKHATSATEDAATSALWGDLHTRFYQLPTSVMLYISDVQSRASKYTPLGYAFFVNKNHTTASLDSPETTLLNNNHVLSTFLVTKFFPSITLNHGERDQQQSCSLCSDRNNDRDTHFMWLGDFVTLKLSKDVVEVCHSECLLWSLAGISGIIQARLSQHARYLDTRHLAQYFYLPLPVLHVDFSDILELLVRSATHVCDICRQRGGSVRCGGPSCGQDVWCHLDCLVVSLKQGAQNAIRTAHQPPPDGDTGETINHHCCQPPREHRWTMNVRRRLAYCPQCSSADATGLCPSHHAQGEKREEEIFTPYEVQAWQRLRLRVIYPLSHLRRISPVNNENGSAPPLPLTSPTSSVVSDCRLPSFLQATSESLCFNSQTFQLLAYGTCYPLETTPLQGKSRFRSVHLFGFRALRRYLPTMHRKETFSTKPSVSLATYLCEVQQDSSGRPLYLIRTRLGTELDASPWSCVARAHSLSRCVNLLYSQLCVPLAYKSDAEASSSAFLSPHDFFGLSHPRVVHYLRLCLPSILFQKRCSAPSLTLGRPAAVDIARALDVRKHLVSFRCPVWLYLFPPRRRSQRELGHPQEQLHLLSSAIAIPPGEVWRNAALEYGLCLFRACPIYDFVVNKNAVETSTTRRAARAAENALGSQDDSTSAGTTRLGRATFRQRFDRMPPSMQYRYLSTLMVEKRVHARLSQIHGMGLFAVCDIPKGEPVVEYVGDLIRNVVADKREKFYAATGDQDASCYMFRLDADSVVDATLAGNVARFINHSCEPNCSCRVIASESGSHHIVVFASREVQRGEEITYDYKFNVEEESLKITCQCGAPSCLGRMN